MTVVSMKAFLQAKADVKASHIEKCPVCGIIVDFGYLDQVKEHLHGEALPVHQHQSDRLHLAMTFAEVGSAIGIGYARLNRGLAIVGTAPTPLSLRLTCVWLHKHAV